MASEDIFWELAKENFAVCVYKGELRDSLLSRIWLSSWDEKFVAAPIAAKSI